MTASALISALALIVSVTTAWFTLWRRGSIKTTRPAVVYFGPDGAPGTSSAKPKLFLRFLLYATGKRGHIIEAMFARLKQGDMTQNFDIWVYGDQELRRGSGLHVPPEGIATNHHFLLPGYVATYQFNAGLHELEIWAAVVGKKPLVRLASIVVEVSQTHSVSLAAGQGGLYFDWNADSRTYRPDFRNNIAEPPRRAIEGAA
jgi:hypothetical protein